MYGQKPLYGLEFHDDSVLDEEIDAVAVMHLDTLVGDRDRHLVRDPEPALPELDRQERHVRALEQAWPKVGVNANRGVHHVSTDLVYLHPPHPPLLRALRDKAVSGRSWRDAGSIRCA